ncbi:hypothetical protein AHAS_Ahas20G0279100 [Arachis hypogaea]
MLLILIKGYLFTDKSANLVSLRWLPLLEDFDSCRWLSWGSALLSYTYHSLCSTARRDMADIARCMPLVMSWIYHRFLTFCHARYDILIFSFALRLDTLRFDEWTLYDDSQLQQMTPDWIRNAREIRIWRSMVPLVCFHFVEFHRVDSINRQLGDIINALVDRYRGRRDLLVHQEDQSFTSGEPTYRLGHMVSPVIQQ